MVFLDYFTLEDGIALGCPGNNNLRCVRSQKSAYVIYNAAAASNLEPQQQQQQQS